jgi:hypothetical protein
MIFGGGRLLPASPSSLSLPTCILHVGPPKTGTSSIQESLYFGLEDPAYRYISLGKINLGLPAVSLFSDQPASFWVYERKRYSQTRLNLARSVNARRLRRALLLVKAHSQTPILSAEAFWGMTAGELTKARSFIQQAGFAVRVIAYVRPVKSFAESLFQQRVKWCVGPTDLVSWLQRFASRTTPFWSTKLDELSTIFGRENLIVRPFVRSELAHGCVVRDFCREVGLTFDPSDVIRVNDSLSVDAVRFLHADATYGVGERRHSFPRQNLLINRLAKLKGEPLRFHSHLFAPISATFAPEEATLRDRYGIDISEDLCAHDNRSCIRHPGDLWRYTRTSLDWLAEASGARPIQECEGLNAALAVASQIERIRRRPSLPVLSELVLHRIRTELRWLSHGD